MSKKPLTLKIQIPFCKEKCGFCDQFTLSGYDTRQKETYLHAVYRELASAAEEMTDYEVTCIHITGGSPCLMGGPVLKELLQNISLVMKVAQDVQITLDCVPDYVGTYLLENLRSFGDVRLQIELETADPLQHLSLQRNFTVGAIVDARNVLETMHWSNFGISLLYGLPGQAIPSLLSSLQVCADMKAARISLSPLRLFEESVLYPEWLRQKEQPSTNPRRRFPNEAECYALYEAGCKRLIELGYQQLSPWDFEKSGAISPRLLENACQAVDVLSLGLGAISRYDGITCENTRDISLYEAHASEFERITVRAAALTPEEEARHRLASALFSLSGVARDALTALSGPDPFVLCEQELSGYLSLGWLCEEDGKLSLTKLGCFHYHEIRDGILPAAAPCA